MKRHSHRSDWHIHTHLSDGASAPLDVLERAAAIGLKEIAITDHDCIDAHRDQLGRAMASRSEELCVRVMTGVEVDSDLGPQDVEVLGYDFDAEHGELVERLALVQSQRRARFAFYRDGLIRLGILEAEHDVLPGASRSPMKVHLYRAVIAAGHTFQGGYNEFKSSLTDLGAPPPLQRPTFLEAVELIRRAGGFTLLAHPLYYAESVGLEPLIEAAIAAGCAGLELVYPYEFGVKGLEEKTARARLRALLDLIGRETSTPCFEETSRGTDVHDLDEWEQRLQELERMERSLFSTREQEEPGGS